MNEAMPTHEQSLTMLLGHKMLNVTLYLLHAPHYRVPEFEASKYLVTNREFLEFVKAGGYEQRELWTEEGE